ncbi:alpha/beta fold hydrolase [Azohydromonas sp.]|uniref:alpha/beta fold hydrolase n=1 Tax=Azohydromonas sp. TaxID=1872666 RepID=UPI002C83B47F|nr:alpha/beta fold hydrolase [Azohydromonas sp.]HMM85236.1 alpha/beta fold hydrolase [Azohydromonas sp.]
MHRPAPPLRRAFTDVDGALLHHAECGRVDAPAVLLLHQTPRSWAEYRAVLPRLGVHCRAIALDTPGFGESQPLAGEPTIERWAAAAVGVLDALGIAQVDLVGHHTGGVIAVEVAAGWPRRVGRVVLSSTPWVDAALRAERARRPPIDEVEPQPDGSHLAALWQRRQAFYPPGRPDLLHAFVLDAMKVGDRLEQGHRAVAAYRMEDRLPRVTHPVRVLRAGADPFAAPHAHALAARLADAHVHEIADGMVPLPDQLPQAFADAVLGFLRRADAR